MRALVAYTRVRCRVEKAGGRWRATLGAYEGTGVTRAAAGAALADALERHAGEPTTGAVLFDLLEPDRIWRAVRGAPGSWGYERTLSWMPRGPTQVSASTFGWDSREEAEDAMRAHWYANNVAPVVDGIVALCTDVRQFTCPRCGMTQQGAPPYTCAGPGCGHVYVERAL